MHARNAELVQDPSLAQHVIKLLLDGIFVKVNTDKGACGGYIHQLDFAKGGENVFALVHVPGLNAEDEGYEIKVAIDREGVVVVLAQDE